MTPTTKTRVERGSVVTSRGREGTFKVMAVADGWALIRRPGCMPFADELKDLTPVGEAIA